MKLNDLTIDTVKLEQGDWVDNIPELPGLRLKVRGANNKDWRRLQTRLVDAVPRKKRVNNRLGPAEQDRITAILLRDTGLLDWDGLEDDDDKPIAYSKEKAEQLLTAPEYVRFREGALWACNMVAERDRSEVEADAGN